MKCNVYTPVSKNGTIQTAVAVTTETYTLEVQGTYLDGRT